MNIKYKKNYIKQYYFLIMTALFFAPLQYCLGQKQKMNVLFISVDDMNNDLGVYGHPQVKSPNIDRLAKEGVTFEKAYCQMPWCSPSRSSMLTGLRPDRTKVMDLQYHFRQHLPDVVTLPQLFKNNGYHVARVGKIYHYGNPGDIGTNSLDDRASWTERINPAGLDKTSLEPEVINYTPQNKGLGAAMAYYSDAKGLDEEHTDGMVADEAIKLLKQNKNKPFFIAAGFYRPHTPWIAPKKYFDLYDIKDICLPEISAETKQQYPAAAFNNYGKWPYLGLTTEQARECKLSYYASISFLDVQIGRLLDALKKEGLDKNTIVVFWSDHGYHLGEHGLWMKQSLFEESARVPLIISMPSNKNIGKHCKQTVELVDIYPTLADLVGLESPKDLDGVSLAPLLKNPKKKWDRPAYTQINRGDVPGHSVRTAKWRYSEWAYGKEGMELYNEDADPKELKNLAYDSQYAEIVKEMKTLLASKHVPRSPIPKGVAVSDTRNRFSD